MSTQETERRPGLAPLLVLAALVLLLYGILFHLVPLSTNRDGREQTNAEPETNLIQEATRGGVVRIDAERLRRVNPGAPDAKCPT